MVVIHVDIVPARLGSPYRIRQWSVAVRAQLPCALIMRRRGCRAHGLDLPLHTTVDFLQSFLVNLSSEHAVCTGQNECSSAFGDKKPSFALALPVRMIVSATRFMCVVASKGRTKVATMARTLLQTEGLTRRFGGVVPANAVMLDIASDEVHAVIGPNGAGKTTLVGLLSGEVTPQEGSIRFDGADITRLPVYRRSQLGLARSFQITSLFHDFTALDNVALAIQAHRGHSFRFWRDARREDELRKPALAALVRVGLGERAPARVGKLSHGEHRQLEIAMALATQPRLLLLDEPMAGMGPEESARMVEILRQLKGSMTILLIEHDMEAVFALADRVSVLVNGHIIASGKPETIRADAAVRQAYLGETEAAFSVGAVAESLTRRPKDSASE
jgi:branched-chain amino acid transport system ATP-binding protein